VEIEASVEIGLGVDLADIIEDFAGDLRAQSRIEKSRPQTITALSRLRRVLRALENVEKS